ncbi:major facilitator superfamily domain-containing protein [Aspergillus bertholletiae]|uniref:Major facilitator superfamily domain-containing protein n=1 Tax=Aspergillus bertholletiae TaxID=1226010 RepID=A0A5N7BBA0_9EURO|nr:major facilitator superfamily domain-containing protein [Aspergillus bertholletiae]
MSNISTDVQLKPWIRDGTVDNGSMPKDTLVNHGPNPENSEKGQASTPRTHTSVEDNEEFTTEYPSSWKLSMIMISLCLAVFCLALDTTIMATAIPKIADQFNSLNDVGWYGSAYLLTTSALTLSFGKLYSFYSIKWVYLQALAMFEIGSLICGATPNSLGLIIGRAIAGSGSAGIYSGSMLIVARSAPLERRPLLTGILGGLFGVASVVGPLIGGAFTDNLSWRWCFYINLPLGAVTGIFLILFFDAAKPTARRTTIRDQLSQLDLLGSLFFLPAIICILLALQWGGTTYPWHDGRIIALFAVFGVLLLAFAGVQRWRQEKATIPPRLITNRNIWGAALFSFCLNASFIIFTYYLPMWFQSIKGVSATKSGIMNLPTVLAVVIFSITSGGLVGALGYYTPFMIIAPVIAAIGAGLLSTLQMDSSNATWIGYQILYGVGVGCGLQQPIVAVQGALAPADLPTGTVIVMFMQTIGGAIFMSVGQNVFQNQLMRNLATQAPSVDAAKVLQAGATMLRKTVSSDMLPVALKAYNSAITEAFYVAVAMAVLALPGGLVMQWISVKGR